MTQQGITLENIKTLLQPSGGQNMQITKQTIGMHLGENKSKHIVAGQKRCQE